MTGELWAWALSVLLIGGTLDRVLIGCEKRGWINYRRNGLSRGAISYHMLELQEFINPSVREVIEARYHEELQQDESGEPPV